MIFNKKDFILLIILLSTLFNSNAYCFPLTPRIINYTVNDYKAGNQNWSVTQDREGRIYFGNNKGVLEFDGLRWVLYTLPNNDIVRCVYYSNDNKLYVGSYEEFGYFTRNKQNQLEYTSLKELLQKFTFNNEEIWNILEYNGKVYFQYFSTYFEYDGKSITANRGFAPLNMFLYKGNIYSQRVNGDLSIYKQGNFQSVVNRLRYGNNDLIAVLPIKKNTLLITRNKGIYELNISDSTITPWNNAVNDELKSATINKAIITKDSCYIIGTLSNGVYALNNKGKLLWQINTEEGLKNNTVLSLLCDRENNIWIGLDNGLAKIYHNSDIYIFSPVTCHIGMVYDIYTGEKESYIASNQGLYYYQNSTGRLKMIEGTEGQTWSISDIDGQIICGHNNGSFRIDGDKIIPLSTIKGARNIIKCNIHNQDILLQNTYTFLNIYKKRANGEWYFSNRVEKFMNLIEHIEVDHLGNIWAQHMHRGIFQISLNENLTEADNVKYYNNITGNGKENLKINIFKLQGRVVFTDGSAFYTYEDLSSSIIPYKKLNDELPSLKNTYKVVPINNSEYWFIDDRNFSLIRFKNNSYTIIHQIPLSSFANSPVDNKGNVYINSQKETYFALNGEIAKYIGIDKEENFSDPVLRIKDVAVYDKNLAEKEFIDIIRPAKIPFSKNNLYITLYCPSFSERYLKIRYRLEGLDEDKIWHENMNSLQKEYSRLPYGEYTFKAELYNNQGIISNIKYSFEINRPFYLSYFAIIIYIILSLGSILLGVYSVYNYTNKKKNRQIIKQQEQHEIELEHQQKQIIELEREQLASELRFKSKELANFTMMSIKNKEFLIHIKEELQQQLEKNQSTRIFIWNLVRDIEKHITSDDDWAIFQTNFDKIHDNFFRNLKEKFPDLTSNDLRLCALLRLNLSSKDICNMMNISLRGIEAARYRLRKRLNIPSEQDLTDFMIRFK
jgi:DNA-binding CsgD family transcriptional regulator